MIRIQKIDEINLQQGLPETRDGNLARDVAEIIANVRERGDKALREYTLRFDGVQVEDFEVSAS